MPRNIEACLSKKTDNWKTPTNIYEMFMKAGYKDTFIYESKYNEFERNYTKRKLFINPPFSKLKRVIEWVIKQYYNDNQIALLIPSRTDTQYFYDLMMYCYKDCEIYFIKGRLHYNDEKSAPFPTMLIILGKKTYQHMQSYCIYQEEIKDVI